MEKRRIVVKIINIAKYIAFMLATVGVFIFQLVQEPIVIMVALSIYFQAFALMFASSVIHCVEVYTASKRVKNAVVDISVNEVVVPNNGELKGQEVEVVNLKSEMVWSVIGAIFFGLFTIFTLVVLILF